MDTYIIGWDKRLKTDKKHMEERRQKAYFAAQRCARLLYQKYGVDKVYLFGSLAKAETFHQKSDIDLAVEGLPSQFYFKALAEIWHELPSGMELDLIPLEDADAEFYKKVLEEGILLHE